MCVNVPCLSRGAAEGEGLWTVSKHGARFTFFLEISVKSVFAGSEMITPADDG